MSYRFRAWLCWLVGSGILMGFIPGCSPAYDKTDADKEVYRIIDDKRQADFGS
jgi:hypothetical protein